MASYGTGFSTERKNNGRGREFFGKYRAKVTNNKDNNAQTGRMGRIKVKCPKVLGDDESNWCTPCLPFAGPGIGSFFMPKVGDTVWIEFEEGNPDKPIWVGNWWGVGELPWDIKNSYDIGAEGLYHMLQTGKISMHFDEKNQRFSLKVADVSIVLDGKANTIRMVASTGIYSN